MNARVKIQFLASALRADCTAAVDWRGLRVCLSVVLLIIITATGFGFPRSFSSSYELQVYAGQVPVHNLLFLMGLLLLFRGFACSILSYA